MPKNKDSTFKGSSACNLAASAIARSAMIFDAMLQASERYNERKNNMDRRAILYPSSIEAGQVWLTVNLKDTSMPDFIILWTDGINVSGIRTNLIDAEFVEPINNIKFSYEQVEISQLVRCIGELLPQQLNKFKSTMDGLQAVLGGNYGI